MSLPYVFPWTYNCSSLRHCQKWVAFPFLLYIPFYVSLSLPSHLQPSPLVECFLSSPSCHTGRRAVSSKKQKHLNRATVKLKCRSGLGVTIADGFKRPPLSSPASHFYGISLATGVIALLHPSTPPVYHAPSSAPNLQDIHHSHASGANFECTPNPNIYLLHLCLSFMSQLLLWPGSSVPPGWLLSPDVFQKPSPF